MLPGPPTIFQSILDHPDRKTFELDTLRLVVTGAALVPVELVRGLWSELGIETVLTAYGLTEACGTVTMCRRGDSAEIIAGTSGRAIPDVEVRIVEPGGAEVARGEAGEVVVRGYNVMRGYFNDTEASEEAIDPDGWLHTGDIGVMDEAGNVAITDRLKDMYVSGGFNVYPAEVEAVLRGHPVRRPGGGHRGPRPADGRGGSGPGGPGRRASRRRPVEDDELIAWARERLANYKVPRSVAWVDALPMNAGGKVLKRELRLEQYAARRHRLRWSPSVPPQRAGHRRRNDLTERTIDNRGRGAMRGIVYTGDEAEVTDELGVRDPGPNEVRVAIGAAGVCHSDLSVINGTIPWKAPSVLGHEGAGVVESVGSEVRSVKPGDHVVIATLASCGTCRACSTGHPTWCIKTLGNVSQPFTFQGEPASNFAGTSVFTEQTIVKEVQAVKISKDVPMTSACLIGCGVLTGVGSVLNRAKVQAGETAAVFGVGGVGLNVIQGLRIAGASRIVAVDTLASKEALGPPVRGHPLRRRLGHRRRGRHP